MPPPLHRLTTKQADAQQRRMDMTHRRSAISNRIRKQKKSAYLAKKRGLPVASSVSNVTSNATTNLTIDDIRRRVVEFVQSPSLASLTALYQAIHQGIVQQQRSTFRTADDSPLFFLSTSPNDEAAANQVLTAMYMQATTPSTNNSECLAIALKLLTLLTGMGNEDTTTLNNNSSDYYGQIPETWSSLLAKQQRGQRGQSSWIPLLIDRIPDAEEASVVLGNMVGDGRSECLQAVLSAGLVRALVGALMMQQPPPAHSPAIAWALTNTIRNDTSSSAATYCCPHPTDTKTTTTTTTDLLTPAFLSHLLMQPSLAIQAAWMIFSLTEREPEVVNYLMQPQHAVLGTSSSSRSLSSSLIQLVGAAQSNPTTATTTGSAHDVILPVLKALGNMAGYDFGVVRLLAEKDMLIPMLLRLIQNPEKKEVSTHAIWVVGCLLCDAGISSHPSTTVAAPAFLTPLFHALAFNSMRTLEEKRELIIAMWNALSQPPVHNHHNDSTLVNLDLIELPPKPVLLQAAPTLVELMSSIDTDAALAAVSVVALLLARSEGTNSWFKIALMEHDIVDALEKVCDTDTAGDAAEIAAYLLDDIFYNDLEDSDSTYQQERGSLVMGNNLNTDSTKKLPGFGRGRGATLPAWKTKS